MPAFKSIAFETLDKTNELAASTLGLPFHSQLSELDFDRIRLSLERALTD
jgi:dTDP-4-amino-4,6-dideoxygalactose transaminase